MKNLRLEWRAVFAGIAAGLLAYVLWWVLFDYLYFQALSHVFTNVGKVGNAGNFWRGLLRVVAIGHASQSALFSWWWVGACLMFSLIKGTFSGFAAARIARNRKYYHAAIATLIPQILVVSGYIFLLWISSEDKDEFRWAILQSLTHDLSRNVFFLCCELLAILAALNAAYFVQSFARNRGVKIG